MNRLKGFSQLFKSLVLCCIGELGGFIQPGTALIDTANSRGKVGEVFVLFCLLRLVLWKKTSHVTASALLVSQGMETLCFHPFF